MTDHNDATTTFGPLPSCPPDPADRVGEVLDRRFVLKEYLGGGGFGLVYRARDERMGDDVALKILRHDRLDAGSFERFKREVRLARRVQGDRLVRIFSLEQTPDEIFLTMELVSGETLRDLMRREGRLEFGRALELGREILLCLEQLHQQDVLHRDVKPAKILIDTHGKVRLADFGLARSMSSDPRSTSDGIKVGSAAYLFPESGENVGPWSDLYSFGIVLFEMLAGRRPFELEDPVELVKAHLDQPVPRLRDLNPSIPRSTATFVERLLRKQPRDRFPSATDALAELDIGSTLGKVIVRRAGQIFKGPALPIALAATLLTTIGGGIWWSSRQADPDASQSDLDEFLRIDWHTERGRLEGISKGGKTLWSKPPSLGDATLIRTGPNEPPAVAAIFQPLGDYGDLIRHELQILEGSTGKTLQRQAFEVGALGFYNPFTSGQGFSDTFGVHLGAGDIDGDGSDEVFASYLHNPYYPTYVLLFEPKLSRETLIFLASGHHRFGGLIDVDEDGHQDALFVGINNLLGYRRVLAAVALPKPDGTSAHFVPWSPNSELFDHEAGLENLLWYALLPADLRVNQRDLSIDRELRMLRVAANQTQKEIRLGFDGLVWDPDEDRASRVQRNLDRRHAYSLLRRADRMRRAGRSAAGLADLEEAHALAHGARLTQLAEAIEARRLVLLVELGKIEAAYEGVDRLVEQQRHSWPANAKDSLFSVARTLHRSGRLDEAITLYQRLLRLTIEVGEGRQSHEPLQKLLMAHLEKENFEAAREDLEHHCSVDARIRESCTLFSSYAQWRSGAPAVPVTWHGMNEAVDRLWYLELRAATSEPRESLLEDIGRAIELDTATTAVLWVMTGEALLDLGRSQEAAEAAERALSTWFRHGDPIVKRFYAADVRRRAERIRKTVQELGASSAEAS